MKTLYLTFLSILLVFITQSFAQESRLEKLLGDGFRSIPAVDRGYNDLCKDCQLKFTVRWNPDTSGIIYNNNYILFRNYVTDSVIVGKSFAYFHELPVSNAEFQEFQNWVRDSVARNRIYDGISSDAEAMKYLCINPKIEDEEREYIFNPEDRVTNRELYPLNWNKKFEYNNPELMPMLVDFYLPPPERFYRNREFDARKCVYEHNEKWVDGRNLENKTTLITYPESFALESKSKFSETTVLAQLYELHYPEMPVFTYSSAQARAFCQWKQEQLQHELNKWRLNYAVSVNLPLSTELDSSENQNAMFTVPLKDYTENWKITTAEYRAFISAVRDSVILEQLYEHLPEDEKALSLLGYKTPYFCESALEMRDINPSDRSKNRDEFAFKSMSKVYKNFKHGIDSLRKLLENKEVTFRYYIQDPSKKAVIGKTTYDTRWERRNEIFEIDVTGEPIGRDANLGYFNRLFHINDALAHHNLARFIHRIDINILPTIPLEEQHVEEQVQGISYEQALAYYHWKYSVWKAQAADDWQNYVFPTKDQLEAIQRGESIIIPEHQVAYPAPIFHYVVQFTEKK